ncbi:MAG: DinB family protein [Chloroflexi bacterium]|nr:DinB family protein [Chloroflexota bacterium]
MSNRKELLRDHITAKNAESMAVLRRLTDADWAKPVYSTESATWTARDVLAHLADSEKGLVAQAQRISVGQEGVPADFDLARWNLRAVEKRANRPLAELLADIQAGYAQASAFLDQVAEADLDRMGRHASGRIMSVEAILRQMADHRATHAAEVKAALGK